MVKYKSETASPDFLDEIDVIEPTDLVNAEVTNTPTKEIFKNTLNLKNTKADRVKFNKDTGKLSLMSGEKELDSATIEIPEGGSDYEVATEAEVKELTDEIKEDIPDTPGDYARTATEEEIDGVKDEVGDILDN